MRRRCGSACRSEAAAQPGERLKVRHIGEDIEYGREECGPKGAPATGHPDMERGLAAGAQANDAGARTGVLDPLGAGLPTGPELYFGMMRANAETLRECLQE